MDKRITALIRRYRSNAEFREAVDDMTAATGLILPTEPLGPLGRDLDEVIHLARFKRAEAQDRAA